MKAKIGLVTLGVADLQKSLVFYRDGLGFPTHDYKAEDACIFFALEGTWLSIYPRQQLADDAQVAADGAGFAGFTLAHNVGSKAEVDAVFGHAVRSGAKPVKTPRDASWGGYSGYFADPDGFFWEVAWNPFTDLT
jgi:catechol 2,3-dioxygenase-like lactoylglutathione lyase family enzyme